MGGGGHRPYDNVTVCSLPSFSYSALLTSFMASVHDMRSSGWFPCSLSDLSRSVCVACAPLLGSVCVRAEFWAI